MSHDRLVELFGPDVADALDEFDLDQEADRAELVERFAGMPSDAPQRSTRMALRTAVLTQILDDDPPESWATAQRLLAAGLSAEQALAQMTLVLTEPMSLAIEQGERFDTRDYVDRLGALPLPEAAEVARALIEAARAEPGIDVTRHHDGVVESYPSAILGLVEAMVDQVLDRLIEGPLHWLPGDRTVVASDLVDGAIFTHRLSEVESELGVLTTAFDLGPLGRCANVCLVDGTEIDQFSVERHHLAWGGPQGWLDEFSPGDLLRFAIEVDVDQDDSATMTATVDISVVDDEPVVDESVLGLVRAGYDELIAEAWLPIDGDDLALWLLFHRPELFATDQMPLVDLCAGAGLEQRGGRVAHDEEVWRTDLFHRRLTAAADLVDDVRFRPALIEALRVLDDPDASVDQVRGALDACAEPQILPVLANILFPHHLDIEDADERDRADSPGRLFELVERGIAVAKRSREVATAEYLAGVLYERCGEPERAEEHLKRADQAQSLLGPVVERLGWYRFDRGDARGAMRWWRTLTVLPQAARVIEPVLDPSRSGARKLGRNEPCWCGSGRKFKQCHQGATDLPPLPDRIGWLARKMSTWVDHAHHDVRATVARFGAVHMTGDPDAEVWQVVQMIESGELPAATIEAGAGDPIVLDCALHEAGLVNLFVRERGALLPEDEQLLIASWATIDRSVHEVVTVDRGRGMTLRDLGTGDVVDVSERSASEGAEVGERYCARVVPDGAGHQIVGGVFPVRAGHETAVLDLCAEGDPYELCAWVGALHQAPTIVHQPGMIDEMVDRDAIEELLANLDGDGDREQVMAELQAEFSRQAQSWWLDESVPALDGLTPREAAADPTRREQLERLLAEFEQRSDQRAALPDGFLPMTYDVAAMRRELGLD